MAAGGRVGRGGPPLRRRGAAATGRGPSATGRGPSAAVGLPAEAAGAARPGRTASSGVRSARERRGPAHGSREEVGRARPAALAVLDQARPRLRSK